MEEKTNILNFTNRALDIKADVAALFGKTPMQKLYDLQKAAKCRMETLMDNYSPTECWMAVDAIEARAHLEGIESAIRVIKGGMGT